MENDIAQWEWNEIPPENIAQYELHLSSHNDNDISQSLYSIVQLLSVFGCKCKWSTVSSAV